jgi:hypothetical protein
MASHTHDATFNFDFDFAMASQPFDGTKVNGQGNTASGYFDEGIDTTTGSSGAVFGQQSFDSILDPSIIAGFGMEQPLVSEALETSCEKQVADAAADLG